MKLALEWLKDHLETDASCADVADALTDLGLEVEETRNPEETLGAFTICRVISVKRHPNADRLRLCRLETYPNGREGPSEEIQVVCGAPNVRIGLVGVFAPVGTHIPGTGIDLKRGMIRGVESCGMLCSERELMISDDHEGIIDLPQDAPLGERFIDYAGLNDSVIEIAVTPNRPDALGVRGIARDLSARGIGKLKPVASPPPPGSFTSPVSVAIDAEIKGKECPAFFGCLIRGVKNDPSPDWLQRRLKAIGLRPISTLVDITNYVMFDRNRPLHAFDADRISGNLRVHASRGGETVQALDGVEYQLEPGMTVISDDRGPECLAGIMGGMATSCTDATTNVFLESALWDPVATARTGRKLKLSSDARYRFERGVDPKFAIDGLAMGVQMILDLCGGEASEFVSDEAIPKFERKYALRTSRVERLVGMRIDVDKQVRILQSLGFAPRADEESISVEVPSWRPDIFGEADLVEEVARIASLASLEGKPLPETRKGVSGSILTPGQKRERCARRTIASLGYNECITYSFVEAKLAGLFADGHELIRLENPISSEMDVMRPDLLPGLLLAAARNQARGAADLALFEVGTVFSGTEPGEQAAHASGLLVGNSSVREPHGKVRPVDTFDVKADAEAVLAAINSPRRSRVARTKTNWWHPGRSGDIFLRPGSPLATFGEIHPRVLRNFRIRGTAVAFSVFLDRVPFPRSRSAVRSTLVLSELQPVERDFAFIVDSHVDAASVVNAVRQSPRKDIIESVSLFDEFAGPQAEEQLGTGKKSLAVSVRLQPAGESFKEEEIAAMGADIAAEVLRRTRGTLRR